MHKQINFMLCLLILGICIFSAFGQDIDYSAIIKSESEWIETLQQPSGAIVMSRKGTYTWAGKQCYKIEPYFTNLTVTGLLENNTAANVEVAKKWINWYFAHLNKPDYNKISGSMYVYYVDPDNNTEYSSSYYDSTDSYGATFISLLKKYYETSGDSAMLLNNRSDIEMIAGSVTATQDKDGLTYAKPDYQIKYTMDNSEVCEGYDSMAYIERIVYKDEAKAKTYEQNKTANYNGIEKKLWNPSKKNYRKYWDSGSDLSIFYPDATCQVFPIWNNVIASDSQKAKDLYTSFNANQPGWPTLQTTDAYPWAILCYAAAKMGDKTRVDTFLEAVKGKYIDKGHPWTWYNMEAGFTIRAASAMLKLQAER